MVAAPLPPLMVQSIIYTRREFNKLMSARDFGTRTEKGGNIYGSGHHGKSPTVFATTGNMIFLTAVRADSVAMVVVVYLLVENCSQAYACAVLSLRSLPPCKPFCVGDYVRECGRHCALRLQLVRLEVQVSFYSSLHL